MTAVVIRTLGCAVAAAVVLLGIQGAAPPPKKPQRIMSLNLCTDLLLLQMVDKGRIASITRLAHVEMDAIGRGRDAGVPTNWGTPEEVIRQRPDLILTGDYSQPLTRRLAQETGANIVSIPDSANFADIRRAVRAVGQAVGEPARAEALVAHMDAVLADLASHPPARRYTVLAWSGGSIIPGRDSLDDAIIRTAGADNLATRKGVAVNAFDVEELLRARPDALLYAGSRGRVPSMADGQGQHRIVRKLYDGRRIAYNETTFLCGLPQSADEAARLRRALSALPEMKR